LPKVEIKSKFDKKNNEHTTAVLQDGFGRDKTNFGREVKNSKKY
jgi:hypothetical protein